MDSTVASPFAKSPDYTGMVCTTVIVDSVSTRRCKFDNVGDNCEFQYTNDTTQSKEKGYYLCNSFYQAENDVDQAVCTLMETAVIETNTKAASNSSTASTAGRRLLQMLGEDAAEGASVGRRGKASTIRRGGSSYAYPMYDSSSSFQGNYEEELGEASSSTNSTNSTTLKKVGESAVAIRVQGLGVCSEVNAELKSQGATCVIAYLHNKAVKESAFTDAADNAASNLAELPTGCETAALAGNCDYPKNDTEQIVMAERCADWAGSG